jgi:hypothetical protein
MKLFTVILCATLGSSCFALAQDGATKWQGLNNGGSRRKFGQPEGWHDRLEPQRQRDVDLGRKGRQQRSGPGQDAREQYDGKAGPGKTGHTKSCGKVRDRPCSCSCHLPDVFSLGCDSLKRAVSLYGLL